MQRLLSRVRIQIQVLLLAGIAVLGIATLGAIYWFGTSFENGYRQTASLGNDIAVNAARFQTRLLQMRQDEKDFIMRNDQRMALQVAEHGLVSQQLLQQLEAETVSAGFEGLLAGLSRVSGALQAYNSQFDVLVESRKRLGMDADSGFRGTLRQSARSLERWIDESGDSALMVQFLSMRRHEWDYMLGGDRKSLASFEKTVDALFDHVDATGMPKEASQQINRFAKSYISAFNGWVGADNQAKASEAGLAKAFETMDQSVQEAIAETTRMRNEAVFNADQLRTLIEQSLQIAFAVMALTIALAAWMIGRSISRPITDMTRTMVQLASGDETVAIPGQSYRNEIGRMAQSVQIFKENAIANRQLEQEKLELEQQAQRERQSIMEDLASDFERTVGSVVTAVCISADALQTYAQTLALAAEDTTERAIAVAGASKEASANILTIAESSDILSRSVSEVGMRAGESETIAAQALAEAHRVNDEMQELTVSADKIGGIVIMIRDIAERTNLLALNATIEAARAGDAGRGFAIVAQEVKALAEQTARATADITTQIGTIQTSTTQTAHAISGIGRIVEDITGISTVIATAVQEQVGSTHDIASSIQQASQGAEGVTVNIAAVTEAAAQSRDVTDQVRLAVEELNRQAEKMRREIQSFLINIRAA